MSDSDEHASKDKIEKEEEEKLWEITTYHGIPDIFRSKTKWLCVIWIVAVVLSSVYMVFEICEVIMEAAEGHWDTSILKQQRADQSQGLEYPTITLCDFNRISQKLADEANMTDELIGYIFAAVPSTYSVYDRYDNADVDARYAAWSSARNLPTYVDVLGAFAPPCEQSILSASFSAKLQPDPCSEPYSNPLRVLNQVNKEMGSCFYLVVNESFTQTKAGSHRGVSVLLYVNTNDYLRLLDNNFAEQGFMMQINFGSVTNRGQWAAIRPGMHYYVAMTMNRFETTRAALEFRAPYCWSCRRHKICSTIIIYIQFKRGSRSQEERPLRSSSFAGVDDPPTKYITRDQYSEDSCVFDCELMAQYEFCGCVVLPPEVLYFDRSHNQTTEEHIMCKLHEWMACKRGVYAEKHEDFVMECSKKCKPLCEFSTVTFRTTAAQYPNKQQRDPIMTSLASRGRTVPASADDLLVIDVYYETLSVLSAISFERKGFTSVVSEIGGLMGIFAGCSVLTLFQFLVYGCTFLADYIRERRARRSSTADTVVTTDVRTTKDDHRDDADGDDRWSRSRGQSGGRRRDRDERRRRRFSSYSP